MKQLQFEIARFLASKATLGKRTTYQEVADVVGWAHPTGRGLGTNLYAILHYLNDLKLPPLTTILVKKGQRYPDEDAMDYIRTVIGNVKFDEAQKAVFSYDWSNIPELRSVFDGLPGGREVWKARFKAPIVAVGDAGQNAFLLKFNGELHGPGGISRPQKLEDWDDKVMRVPWTGPRASSTSDKSPGQKIAAGDLLYLWAHEDEAFGSGFGLTGISTAKSVSEQEGFLNIQLGDLALLRHPFGFRALGDEGWDATILDRIDADRRPRAWLMTLDERSELDQLIATRGLRKTEAMVSVELEHLSTLDRALSEDRDEVVAAEEERKTTTSKARPGQQKFRDEAMLRHDGCCAITGFNIPTVLEAAHVIPHTGNPAFEVPENSLILRRDVHALFDAGLIGINPKSGRLVVSIALKTTGYRNLENKLIEHRLASASLSYQYARFKKTSL